MKRKPQNACSGRCAHHSDSERGCTIPEDRLDWRGDPLPGRPWECRYLTHPPINGRAATGEMVVPIPLHRLKDRE